MELRSNLIIKNGNQDKKVFISSILECYGFFIIHITKLAARRKTSRTNSTFGFLLTHKSKLKKPMCYFLANAKYRIEKEKWKM